MKTMEDDPIAADPPAFLTTSEVSKALGVSPNAVTRWAREGRLACQVTLGGHHRFQRAVIEDLTRSLNRCAAPARRGP